MGGKFEEWFGVRKLCEPGLSTLSTSCRRERLLKMPRCRSRGVCTLIGLKRGVPFSGVTSKVPLTSCFGT